MLSTLEDQYIYFYDITGVEMFQNIRFYSKLTKYKSKAQKLSKI